MFLYPPWHETPIAITSGGCRPRGSGFAANCSVALLVVRSVTKVEGNRGNCFLSEDRVAFSFRLDVASRAFTARAGGSIKGEAHVEDADPLPTRKIGLGGCDAYGF
ncbi:MAG: hypothetical protein AAFR23_08415 [Pseudomonadota bacterium]